MSLADPFAEQVKLQTETLYLKMRIVGTTAADSGIKLLCMNAGAVEGYSDEDGLTIASKLGFTTTELDDDAAAAVVGVHVPVTNAAELIDVQLCKDAMASASVLSSGSDLGSLTSIALTLYGTSNTGVTSTGGLAFTLTLTSLDSDSAIGNEDFWIKVVYKKTGVA